jgi:DEAD/DEAH box helicase domain-containing protein
VAEPTPQRNVNEPHFDTIVLDVETVRGPDEVGGWRYAERFGLAVAVTWDSTHGYREWFEGDAGDLVEELSRFDRVVGFNLIDFDYRVLAAYRPDIVALLSGKTVDILAHVHQALGFRVSLDSLAHATLGRGKTSAGDQAIKWWRGGNVTW